MTQSSDSPIAADIIHFYEIILELRNNSIQWISDRVILVLDLINGICVVPQFGLAGRQEGISKSKCRTRAALSIVDAIFYGIEVLRGSLLSDFPELKGFATQSSGHGLPAPKKVLAKWRKTQPCVFMLAP